MHHPCCLNKEHIEFYVKETKTLRKNGDWHLNLYCIQQLQFIVEVLQNEMFWVTWKDTELYFNITVFHIEFNDFNCKLKFFLVEKFNSAKVAFISGKELIVQ